MFHLFVDVFKSDSNNPNDGKDERSKSEGAEVVSEGPPKSSGDRKRASGLTSGGEVPSADAANEHVGEDGLQELTNPEESEDMDVGHIFLLLAKGDALKL